MSGKGPRGSGLSPTYPFQLVLSALSSKKKEVVKDIKVAVALAKGQLLERRVVD